MPKSARRQQREAEEMLRAHHEVTARQEGPAPKNWTRHDLLDLMPRTDNQRLAMREYLEGNNLAMLGSAGVGKTFLACYLAARSLVDDEDIDKIVIVRSAVQGRDVGALPGTLDEKLAEYEVPYHDAFGYLFGKPTTYRHMKDRGKIQFACTSFLRSVTFRNAVLIVEEAQNMKFEELDTVLTRPSDECRVIITGDSYRQCDLGRNERSGLPIFEQCARDVANLSMVHFTKDDSVRGRFVTSWLRATERYFMAKRAREFDREATTV